MINEKIIKVCGMRQASNIRQVEALGIDLMGFIFYPKSSRYVCELPDYMPQRARRTGVFVNEDKQIIKKIADRFCLDYIQLHGNESPDYCHWLHSSGLQLIKAFSVEHPKDLQHVLEYEPYCKYFLFDTKCNEYGGSGKQFNWEILHNYSGNTPFLLSGGIHADSIQALKEFSHPQLAGFDLNSRFELSPGIKDVERIQRFLCELAG